MYDNAWAYGPGNFQDAGVNYSWEPAYYGQASGTNWGAIGQGFLGLANTWVQADATIKMQKAMDGRQAYVEGQPIVMKQDGVQISGGLLLLLGIGALVMLAKD